MATTDTARMRALPVSRRLQIAAHQEQSRETSQLPSPSFGPFNKP
jgi:hypothetical protein